MPLRALDDQDNDVLAFTLDSTSWSALKGENHKSRHLRMPCCGHRVVLKTSKYGTQFFAHARRGECAHAPETEHHIRLKTIVAIAVHQMGWTVSTEVSGTSPDGTRWVADVLASKGNARLAFEIQWSRQSDDETWRRQTIYEQSGIRCLWLFRQTTFPISPRLPAVCIHDEPSSKEYYAMIRSDTWLTHRRQDIQGWHQSILVSRFIELALDRCFHFGLVRPGETVKTEVMGKWNKCWKCKQWTHVIVGVHMIAKNERSIIEISDLDKRQHLLKTLGIGNLRRFKVGLLKERYSKTAGGKYLSNGCYHCDALQGQFYDALESHRAEPLIVNSIVLTDELSQLFNSRFQHWHVTAKP